MTAPRAALALYLAVALHALLLLGLALRPPSQDAVGPGRGISLAGEGEDAIDLPPRAADAARTPMPAQIVEVPVATVAQPLGSAEAAAARDPIEARPAQRRAAVEGGGASPGQRDLYLHRLRVHLADHRRELPQGTGRGRAQVAFLILADGRVQALDLVESSGMALLDAEALALVQRAAPMPRPPRGPIRVVVPLSIGR